MSTGEPMIFRITGKLGKKIGIQPSESVSRADDPFLDWTANVFRADRKQYIIVANTSSLYCVLMRGRGVTDADTFTRRTISAMGDLMNDDGNRIIYNEFIAGKTGDVRFSKTPNRSIVGSLNQMVKEAEGHITRGRLSLQEANFRLNRTLLSILGDEQEEGLSYGRPREAFRELVKGQGNA